MFRVEHECEIETEHEDTLFPPDRNYLRKAFYTFRSLLMASGKNPGARKYLRSRASIISEKRRHLHNYKHILHPFSAFRYIFLETKFYICEIYYLSTYVKYINPLLIINVNILIVYKLNTLH